MAVIFYNEIRIQYVMNYTSPFAKNLKWLGVDYTRE